MVCKTLCFMLAALCAASAAPEGRITGGTDVDISEVPYMVSLVYHYPRPNIYIQRCVGSLISSWHILTVAYCFTGAIQDNFTLRAGSSTSLSGGVTSTIQQVIQHPDYVATPRQNDIAIVFAKEPFRITNVVNSLRLPPQTFTLGDGAIGVVTGWGFDKEQDNGGTQHESLKKIELRKVPASTCTSAFSDVEDVSITDTVFCASETDKGICFGDAGAPFVSTVYNSKALVGVSSYYQDCGSTYPDIFVRVEKYSNWILEVAVAPSGRRVVEGDTPAIA
ncbi:unnamed protein product [Pieris brassicae]|uniref:Peptidase S1 domain-containing protein n=1 Tax=Pieris brassicae TaxID=7116 RepID=A0A9P0TI99_PIEBR|nr:unnamed protein product [Pieris brassicae]